jgi:thioredoxin reductase
MSHDVIIIGGSFAGLAAAIQLGRARRSVLVIDAGQPRNRFATHAHGLLGFDGASPQTILTTTRNQLATYPTVTILNDAVTSGQHDGDLFTIATTSGTTHTARRLILASGVTDVLPDLPGIHERWGQSVFHCPYCHGYEVRDQPLGILATSDLAMHQAQLVRDWTSDLTVFTMPGVTFTPEQQETLTRLGIRFETRPVVALSGDAPHLAGVILNDGSEIPVHGLFVASRVIQTNPLIRQLGIDITESAMGETIATTGHNQTSIPGIFAAGDAAVLPHSLSLAIASGMMAGVAAHRSLVFDPALLTAA